MSILKFKHDMNWEEKAKANPLYAVMSSEKFLDQDSDIETWSDEDWQQNGGDGTYMERLRWVGVGAGFTMAVRFRVITDKYISLRQVRIRAQ